MGKRSRDTFAFFAAYVLEATDSRTEFGEKPWEIAGGDSTHNQTDARRLLVQRLRVLAQRLLNIPGTCQWQAPQQKSRDEHESREYWGGPHQRQIKIHEKGPRSCRTRRH